MRKKQKINKKKQSQRAYKGFIFLVNWHKNKFDVIPYISNIYENEDKKEVSCHAVRSFLHGIDSSSGTGGYRGTEIYKYGFCNTFFILWQKQNLLRILNRLR